MTPEALARLHAACFADAPRPWSATEFTSLLNTPGTHLLRAPHGFAILRLAGPEGELLTLAVDPGHRRRGIARNLLAQMFERARAKGATEVILEVAATNSAAHALYLAAGFAEVGQRKDYYTGPRGTKVSALVMKKALAPVRPALPDGQKSR